MPNKPLPAVVSLLAACLACAAPALWVMWPVLLAPDASLAGLGFGDNVAALWNVWWFTQGTHITGWPYWTPMLFAPFGTQLSLHTHATTHSFLAWPWTSVTSLTAAHNGAIATGMLLNGICTFLLAFRATGRALPAAAAGLLFSAAAQPQLRVLGHINLVHAWVLPLFALALTHFSERPGTGRSLLLGTAAALVAYTDYYYAVFALVFLMVWTAASLLSVRIRARLPRTGPLTGLLVALLGLDVIVIAIIAMTDGTALSLGPLRVSLRGLRNPLTLLWLLLAVLAWRRYRPSIAVGWRSGRPTARASAPAILTAAVLMALTAPLWLALLQVILSGDYVTQRVFWRSSPAGGDLLTLVLGHPRHVVTGGWTMSGYSALGIDVMEQSLWLGLVPLMLLAIGPRHWTRMPGARVWLAVGIVFATLALGPFLRFGGFDTALPLPHALLRYVPVLSNARIPGRSVVMVQLAVAMLAAFALAGRSSRASAVVLLLLALESFPGPVPVQAIPSPDAVDEILRTSTVQGAVAELPMGLRDGFGEAGAFDHRALAHQMYHARPIAGGFVARLSPSVRRAYEASPILQEFLRVSSGSGGSDLEAGAAARAVQQGLAFLVLNRDGLPDGRLSRPALERAGFTFVVASGPRELYAAR
jgi:hypothetical protein